MDLRTGGGGDGVCVGDGGGKGGDVPKGGVGDGEVEW